jgi:DNA-binding NarL/FixJ family response regulator
MASDRQGQPLRVLIADGDARARSALRTFLITVSGFDVVGETDNAEAAMMMAREHAPSVALVDVLLPGVSDGLSLLRVLTSELRIPVVAISIHGGLRDSALDAGASRFLGKESAPELLVAALLAAAGPSVAHSTSSRRPRQMS